LSTTQAAPPEVVYALGICKKLSRGFVQISVNNGQAKAPASLGLPQLFSFPEFLQLQSEKLAGVIVVHAWVEIGNCYCYFTHLSAQKREERQKEESHSKNVSPHIIW